MGATIPELCLHCYQWRFANNNNITLGGDFASSSAWSLLSGLGSQDRYATLLNKSLVHAWDRSYKMLGRTYRLSDTMMRLYAEISYPHFDKGSLEIFPYKSLPMIWCSNRWSNIFGVAVSKQIHGTIRLLQSLSGRSFDYTGCGGTCIS